MRRAVSAETGRIDESGGVRDAGDAPAGVNCLGYIPGIEWPHHWIMGAVSAGPQTPANPRQPRQPREEGPSPGGKATGLTGGKSRGLTGATGVDGGCPLAPFRAPLRRVKSV